MNLKMERQRIVFFSIIGITVLVIILITITSCVSSSRSKQSTTGNDNIRQVGTGPDNGLNDDPNDDSFDENNSKYVDTWAYRTAYKNNSEVKISDVYGYVTTANKQTLILNSDWTFKDNVHKIDPSATIAKSSTGKYEIAEKTIKLIYSDDTTKTLQIYESNNIIYIKYPESEYTIYLTQKEITEDWSYGANVSNEDEQNITNVNGLDLLWIYDKNENIYNYFTVKGEFSAIKSYKIYPDKLVIAINSELETPYMNFQLNFNRENLSGDAGYTNSGLATTLTDEDGNKVLIFDFEKEFNKNEIKNMELLFGDIK